MASVTHRTERTDVYEASASTFPGTAEVRVVGTLRTDDKPTVRIQVGDSSIEASLTEAAVLQDALRAVLDGIRERVV